MSEQTNAFTAETATMADALPMQSLTLIGTFGKDGAAGALVRLPGGRIRRVSAGDRLAGHDVQGIEPGHVTLESGRGLRVLAWAS